MPQAANVHFFDAHPAFGDCRSEIVAGLQREQKTLDPKWFYDAEGSAIFERITRLPEYYPTRAEVSILTSQREAIAQRCGLGSVFIEPGAGNCAKARLLLDALRPSAFVPLDISADFLFAAARGVGEDFPWLEVTALCADFRDFRSFEDHLPVGRRVLFYPGSTIGNLDPDHAIEFLSEARDLVGADGGALIGVDLHKSTGRLESAYNDAQGVTAEFNLNILRRVNDLVGSDFDPDRFAHRAFYNERLRRIEMHLVSEQTQSVCIDGLPFHFEAGESIHTESSYKYSVEDFSDLAARAGLQRRETWLDHDGLFALHYLEPLHQ
ncbi:putative methyltransferase [Luminiphilus syltensis NOR5-1B]|uniref:Putative methyltransferase n=2 Tax=Luminiphilus TaxID=1341118 RepID=B8KU10_9GAMM|nr:putative methyltransferase [Luminiphilus syltensis NOR5-1B]